MPEILKSVKIFQYCSILFIRVLNRRAEVCALLGACPDVVQRFANVLVSFLGAEKPGQRLLAVDVCLALAEAFPGQVPVQARILDRCKDPAPTVRAKAFSGLSVLVQGDCKDDSLKEMLTNKESEKYVDVAALFNVHVADPKPMVRKAAVTVFDAMIPFLIEKVRIFLGHALGSGGVGEPTRDRDSLGRHSFPCSPAAFF